MSKIVKIAGRSWVLGLTWSSYNAKPSNEEIAEDAERLKADWAAIRLGNEAVQGGFCEPVDDQTSTAGLYSLAAFLADSEQQPWLGIFQISEGLWWYIAVRDRHEILPDGDFVGNEEEIISARERHAGFGDWNYIDGDLSTLERLIKAVKAKPVKVKSLTGYNLPPVKNMIAAAVISVFSIVGYFSYQHYLDVQEAERLAEIERIRAQIAANKPPIKLVSPMLIQPTHQSWLNACRDVIYNQKFIVHGWQIDQVTCNIGSVDITWKRQLGANVSLRPDGHVTLDGNTISKSIQIEGLIFNEDENLESLEEIQLKLRAWAQKANFNLTFITTPVEVSLPGAEKKEEQIMQIPSTAFSLDMPVSPLDFNFDNMPGLRLTTLRSKPNGWILEGTVYGR